MEEESRSPAPDPRLMCSGSSGLLSKVRYSLYRVGECEGVPLEEEPRSPVPDPRLMCSGSSGLLSKVRYTGRGSVRGCLWRRSLAPRPLNPG
jgi:hypothetical protein